MKSVLVKGPALSHSGYGEHTRFILRSLRTRPDLFDIFLLNINWGQTSWIAEDSEERQWLDFILNKTIMNFNQGLQPDISIQVTVPGEFERLADYNIGATAGTETTKISPDWLQKCMNMDKIIVVSNHTKYAFENTSYDALNQQNGEEFKAKVTCPVEVIGYPVKQIEKENIDIDLKYDFNFLTVGTWITRKNLENTIKWFVNEFYDQEVGLIVKTSRSKNSLRDRLITLNGLKELMSEFGDDRKCEVKLLHGDLSQEEMTGLYNHPSVKALVSLSHGEGYGLPMFEAAYNGLPIITTNWGGQVDFLNMPVKEKNGKLKIKPMFTEVAYDIKPIQNAAVWDNVLIKDSMWAFPKEWSAKKAMRSAYKNYNGILSKATKLQKWVLENFKEEEMQNKLCNLIYDPSKEEEEWLEQMNEIQVS